MTCNIKYLQDILKAEIELTEHYVNVFSESKDVLANKAIKYIVNSKGKLLRPTLLILSAKYSHQFNKEEKNEAQFIDDVAKAAAILELIQISSLVHDDVLDGSSTRRKKGTLNSFKGNRFAILMGDYLIAQSLKNCFMLVNQAGRQFDSTIMYSFLENISKLVLGEIQQNNFNEKEFIPESAVDYYLEIIENKTASLFALSCSVGADIANSDASSAILLKEFGQNIGMAYQIIDDLRDFSFDKQISGEKNFQDVEYGIKTLPVILALSSLNGDAYKLTKILSLGRQITQKEKCIIVELLHKTNSFEYTYKRACSYLNKALNALNRLPENEYHSHLLTYHKYLANACDELANNIIFQPVTA